jgi:hypothetical protein
MEVTARFVKALSAKSGTGRDGNPWISQTIVVETIEQYPKTLAIDYFGDANYQLIQTLHVGQELICTGHVESREWDGKYYTSFKGRSIKIAGGIAPQAQAQESTPAPAPAPAQQTASSMPVSNQFNAQPDDLPF